MVVKTEKFLEILDSNKVTIILPSPIIAEVLSPVSNAADRDYFMAIIRKRFRIAPLDDLAAQIAGEIWGNTPQWREYYKEGEDNLKSRFKYDLLILAIAIRQKASCLYTEDEKLKKLAEANRMIVKGIPNTYTQESIKFLDQEQGDKGETTSVNDPIIMNITDDEGEEEDSSLGA